jgi:hypothetical protein
MQRFDLGGGEDERGRRLVEVAVPLDERGNVAALLVRIDADGIIADHAVARRGRRAP